MQLNNKFAIIGLGFIFPKHMDAIASVGGEIVSVCDIDPKKYLYSLPNNITNYTDYKEMLDKTDADFVVICAPNYLHTEMILECAKRGKTILSEKPMTFTLKEIELLKGVPKLYGMFQLRYLPEIGEMRKLSRGAKEVVMNVEMKRSKTYHESWKGDPIKTGGLLMNIGCHYFDLLGHLFSYEQFLPMYTDIRETEASGELMFVDLNFLHVKWRIAFVDEKESYERSITIDGRKFDLIQKENLHIRAYEDLMWCHGITAKEEEKIIKMISIINAR